MTGNASSRRDGLAFLGQGALPLSHPASRRTTETSTKTTGQELAAQATGETARLRGTVRLDMTGLDPIANPPVANQSDLAIRVRVWNAAVELGFR